MKWNVKLVLGLISMRAGYCAKWKSEIIGHFGCLTFCDSLLSNANAEQCEISWNVFRFIAFGGGTRLRYHWRDANDWQKPKANEEKQNANSIVRPRLTQLTSLKWINLRLSKLANHNAPYTVQHRIVCLNAVCVFAVCCAQLCVCEAGWVERDMQKIQLTADDRAEEMRIKHKHKSNEIRKLNTEFSIFLFRFVRVAFS